MATSQGGASAGDILSPTQQIELIEAFERGEDQTIVLDWVKRYPQLSDDIVNFMLALRIVDGPDVAIDPTLDAAIERGMALGMQRIHAAAPAAQMNLVAAMQAAGVTKPQLAKHLHIGLKVVDKFVQGQIALASIPQRFFAQIAQSLNASIDQVQSWAQQSSVVVATLRRAQAHAPEATPQPVAQESFAEAVRTCSPKSMSATDRALWLHEVGE